MFLFHSILQTATEQCKLLLYFDEIFCLFKMNYSSLKRIWTNKEWDFQIAFGRVQCARLGRTAWEAEERLRFETQMIFFDRHTNWLDCTMSRRSLGVDGLNQRRQLVVSLRTQFLHYVRIVQFFDNEDRNAQQK